MPFFPEVHEALTRLWKAPFTARNKSVAPPTSPPSMVEPLWGTRASASARGPETGDPESEETAHWEMVTAPLPPRRRAGWRIFCSCSTIGPEASGTQNFTKSSFLSLWVPRGGELRAVHHGIASLLLSPAGSSGCPRAPILPIRGTR